MRRFGSIVRAGLSIDIYGHGLGYALKLSIVRGDPVYRQETTIELTEQELKQLSDILEKALSENCTV